MKAYLFLLAWIDGSDSTDESTKVHSSEDLMPEYLKGNEHIFSVLLMVPETGNENEEEIASKWGYTEAFYNNYTAHDSVSICASIDSAHFTHPHSVKSIIINI